MSIFARENRVLWVERRPRMKQLGTLSGDVRHIADNLYVFSYPTWAPISGRTPIKQITKVARRIALQSAMQKAGMTNNLRSQGASSGPVVWFSHPRMTDLIDEIPRWMLHRPAVRLYHVVDEYTAYSSVTPEIRQTMEHQEQEMMSIVDAVIVVSKVLYKAKSPFNEHTYVVPNGVDYDAYSEALADPELPQELARIVAPRLGYSGLVGDRLDLGMLRALAQEHPEWSLVFLGEARVVEQIEHWEAMLQLPNVHYVGQVDVSRVPHFLKGFDVGLMPYLTGRESESISPLKLYDYLAAGLPIASIDIPSAREFDTQIHLAKGRSDSMSGSSAHGDSAASFAQAVQAALNDVTPERRRERRKVAAGHTWEARVEQLSQIIEAQLVSDKN